MPIQRRFIRALRGTTRAAGAKNLPPSTRVCQLRRLLTPGWRHEGLKAAAAKVLKATWQRCKVGLLKKPMLCFYRCSIRTDTVMIGSQDRWQDELFVVGSLRELIPDDHVLKRVECHLDLGWLRAEITDCYCEERGRPSVDPEAAVRLMLAGFLCGIVHDRRLVREGQVNLAIRWFAGYKAARTPARSQFSDTHTPTLGSRAISAHLRANGPRVCPGRISGW